MGSLDTNGIYVYDENDPIVPLQSLLNLLGSSVSEAIQAATQPIYLHLDGVSSPTISSGGWNRVTGWGVRSNVGGWEGNPTAGYTVPMDGVYYISTSVTFATNGTGIRRVRVLRNGTTTLHASPSFDALAGTQTSVEANIQVELRAGQTIMVDAFQNSNAPLQILVEGAARNHFNIMRISALGQQTAP